MSRIMEGYAELHQWLRNNIIKPEFCEVCGLNKPNEIANISGEYKWDLTDYKYLCYKCHKILDGTIYNIKYQEKDHIPVNNQKTRKCSSCERILPNTNEFFSIDKKWLSSRCKDCRNKYFRRHRKNES